MDSFDPKTVGDHEQPVRQQTPVSDSPFIGSVRIGAVAFRFEGACRSVIPPFRCMTRTWLGDVEACVLAVGPPALLVIDHRRDIGATPARVELWVAESPVEAPAELLVLVDARPTVEAQESTGVRERAEAWLAQAGVEGSEQPQ